MTENPISSANQSARASRPSETNPTQRILVVDDDGDIRRLNTEALLASGYEVDAVVNGAAAWQALHHDSYDLMITDNNMPKLTGVELLEKMRAARMTLPVIIASGTYLPEGANGNAPLGPAATLLKPYTIEALVQAVKKILGEVNDSTTGVTARLSPPRATHRILVVDDDRDLRQMYSEVLAGTGYQVDSVADSAAGWAALQKNLYGLLITEHDLPGLSGVALIRKIRAAYLTLPIVMVAGRLPSGELARNPSLQLAATLTKPFAMDVLLNTVNQVLHASAGPSERFAPRSEQQSQPPAGNLRYC